MTGKKKTADPPAAESFETLPEELRVFVQALTLGASFGFSGGAPKPTSSRKSRSIRKPQKKAKRSKTGRKR